MNSKESVAFMRDLEARYKLVSRLESRAQYKIFYGLVRPAEILVCGINPGGNPEDVSPDGTRNTKKGTVAAASSAFYENDECDLLDCDWPENKGLKKLLVPLLDGNQEAIRKEVVKTNIAFRRSAKAAAIDLKKSTEEAAPFVEAIVAFVRPRLIILTSVDLRSFMERYCEKDMPLSEKVSDVRVNQVVYESVSARLRGTESDSLIVRVAHASQFSWTYEKHNVVDRIKTDIGKLK